MLFKGKNDSRQNWLSKTNAVVSKQERYSMWVNLGFFCGFSHQPGVNESRKSWFSSNRVIIYKMKGTVPVLSFLLFRLNNIKCLKFSLHCHLPGIIRNEKCALIFIFRYVWSWNIAKLTEEWKHLIRWNPFINKFIQFNCHKFTVKCSNNSKLMWFIITWLPHYKISINATSGYFRNETLNTYTSIDDKLIDQIKFNDLTDKEPIKKVLCLESEY